MTTFDVGEKVMHDKKYLIDDIKQHLNLWETHNHDPPPDKIMPEAQEERIKFTADNNDCDYYEDPPFYDEGCQVTYEDDYSQLTHYEDIKLVHLSKLFHTGPAFL